VDVAHRDRGQGRRHQPRPRSPDSHRVPPVRAARRARPGGRAPTTGHQTVQTIPGGIQDRVPPPGVRHFSNVREPPRGSHHLERSERMSRDPGKEGIFVISSERSYRCTHFSMTRNSPNNRNRLCEPIGSSGTARQRNGVKSLPQ
jgi:hypothetical protein